jgi:hypothetical protein
VHAGVVRMQIDFTEKVEAEFDKMINQAVAEED